jgi:G2/mitotic-specific cyclin 3/4
MIMECCENPQKHHSAVYEKYSDRRYKRASVFVSGEMERGFVLPSSQAPLARPSLLSFDDSVEQIQYETRDSFKRLIQVKG